MPFYVSLHLWDASHIKRYQELRGSSQRGPRNWVQFRILSKKDNFLDETPVQRNINFTNSCVTFIYIFHYILYFKEKFLIKFKLEIRITFKFKKKKKKKKTFCYWVRLLPNFSIKFKIKLDEVICMNSIWNSIYIIINFNMQVLYMKIHDAFKCLWSKQIFQILGYLKPLMNESIWKKIYFIIQILDSLQNKFIIALNQMMWVVISI